MKPSHISVSIPTRVKQLNSYPRTIFFRERTSRALTPKLPVIDEIVSTVLARTDKPNLENTIFIGVQHLLETTLSLFNGLIALGAKPHNMYFSGKCYSSAPEVERAMFQKGIQLIQTGSFDKLGGYQEYCQENIKKLWQHTIKDIENKKVDRIVILDEGGRTLENTPKIIRFKYPIAAVEQTQAGLNNPIVKTLPFPLIEVASSAAKKQLESTLIAEAVVEKLKKKLNSLSLSEETVCGIIGNGPIGYAVAHYLLDRGHTVIVYDKNEMAFSQINRAKFIRMDKPEAVIENAQCIFGCTGYDALQDLDILNLVKDDKVLISCTSEDKEFKSLLKTIAAKSIVAIDPLSDITCFSYSGNKILIVRGGFPVNFDNTPSSVPANDIQLTRGLLLGGLLQAVQSAKKPIGDGYTLNQPSRQMLDPYMQRFVVTHWRGGISLERFSKQQLESFQDIDWIMKHSGGAYNSDSFLTECFSSGETVLPTHFMQSK